MDRLLYRSNASPLQRWGTYGAVSLRIIIFATNVFDMKKGKYTLEEKRLADDLAKARGSDFAVFVCNYKGGKAFLGGLNELAYVGIPPAILVKDGKATELSIDDALYLIGRS